MITESSFFTMKKTNLVGENVRRMREYRKITQEEAGKVLNLEPESYGHYERGRSPFRADQLEELARLFGCKVAYFFGEQNDDDLLEAEVAEMFRDKPEAEKRRGLEVLRAMYRKDEENDLESGRTYGKRAEDEEPAE